MTLEEEFAQLDKLETSNKQEAEKAFIAFSKRLEDTGEDVLAELAQELCERLASKLDKECQREFALAVMVSSMLGRLRAQDEHRQ